MKEGQKLGLYLNPRTIVRNPGYLEVLRSKLGLNLTIISFTGELPGEVLAKSPFKAVPPSEEQIRFLTTQHIDGRPTAERFDRARQSVGPHISAGGNEGELQEAIRRAQALGLEVWLLAGAWTANDFDLLMYCPSKEENNRWYEAVFVHLATDYDVEGLDVTHARFPMTSQPRGLFICACDDCAQAAADMGYDMGQMKADIYTALEGLRRLEGKRVVDISNLALGPLDFMQLLGARPGVMQWFNFRAELLARNLKRFRDAVHTAAGPDFIFGADTYPASLSMFVGHNHSRWAEFSDFASPLLSHVDIFPMKTMVAWAQFLERQVKDLSEAAALETIYRLVGYDGLGLPTSIEDFALGAPDCEFRNIPLEKLLLLDMAKARAYLPEGIPSYPIIQGGGAPHDWPRESIEGLIAGADQLGHNGIMLQGTRSLVDFALKA